MRCRTALPFLLLAATASAHAEDAASPYAPLAFLTNKCWRGTLPNKDVDVHCFRAMFKDKFVRDTHVVRGAGHEEYRGETTYFYDSVAKKLRYLYVESDGGSSLGDVDAKADVLSFPETTMQQDGKTTTFRSRWTHAGADAYDVVTEFKQPDGSWKPGWTVHMTPSKKAE